MHSSTARWRAFRNHADKADIELPSVEADRDAAGWSAARGSVRNRAPGLPGLALGRPQLGLVCLSLTAGHEDTPSS